LLRRYVAAGAATYNNQNKTKQTKETNEAENGKLRLCTQTARQQRERSRRPKKEKKGKEKEKEKLADGWTKNHQPLLIPRPFL
jgi:hypothetical protein